MIRVLLVGPSPEKFLGGQAIQLSRLHGRLQHTAGIAVETEDVTPTLAAPLGALQRVKYVRTVVTTLAYIAHLARRARQFDVLHVFSASYWSFMVSALPAVVIGRLAGRRVLLNYRSGEAEDHLSRWPLAARLVGLADMIVAPSGYLVDVFARFGLQARAIFNFVDADRWTFRDRGSLSPVFFANRNLEPLYNVSCVLRAFSVIQAELPTASLTVAGDGSERARLEALASELGLRNVQFIGRVHPDHMADRYAAADVYLNSPNIDNMPTSIVEAYACGIPVVTTDAGGIPYIARHEETALVVPRDDAPALANAALRLFREPGLAQRLARTARDEVESRYVWPAVEQQWVDAYRTLVATPPRVRPPGAQPPSARVPSRSR